MGYHQELDERRVLAQGVDPRIHSAAARDRDLLAAAAVAVQEPHEVGEVRPTPMCHRDTYEFDTLDLGEALAVHDGS